MDGEQFILAIDQGETCTKAILFDKAGECRFESRYDIQSFSPKPGWTEFDPEEIYNSVVNAVKTVLKEAGINANSISALGIANQRGTTVVWDKATGKPIHRAIAHQSDHCQETSEQVAGKNNDKIIRKKTGGQAVEYSPALKVKWLLDNVPEARERAEEGDLLFGNIDSWLVWKLSGGQVHITDCSNASQTLAFDIYRLCWDQELLDIFTIPDSMLPEVRSSSDILALTDPEVFDFPIPINGIAEGRQASLFGHACFEVGAAKCVFGTGCRILMNTGKRAIQSKHGFHTGVAWKVGDQANYYLEGKVRSAGAAVQWLKKGLGLISRPEETEIYSNWVESADGVYVVPTFGDTENPSSGSEARGAIFGLTYNTRRDHLVRAVLESIAYQTCDILTAMADDVGTKLKRLCAGGGAAANDFLMQFQAGILDVPVERLSLKNTKAIGVAYLAGLASGFWQNTSEVSESRAVDRLFESKMDRDERNRLYRGWTKAVNALNAFK